MAAVGSGPGPQLSRGAGGFGIAKAAAAHFGQIDLGAQAEVANVRRADTPKRFHAGN
jgi:hypothetical protein